MTRDNKKTILALSLSLAVLAVLAAFYFFLYKKIKDASALVAAAESKIALLEREGREFSAAATTLKDLSADIDLVEKSFLTEKTFVDFIELLEQISRKAGVEFTAETANLPASPAGGPASSGERASLSFEVRGNFQSLVNFFALLDKMPYAGIVDSAAISQRTEFGQKTTTSLAAKIHYVIFNFSKE